MAESPSGAPFFRAVSDRPERGYVPPTVLRSACIELEAAVLSQSVVDAINAGLVISNPQEVEEYDFSDREQFWHTWE